MSFDDGLDHRQSVMGLMELGTAAGRKEVWSARAIRQAGAAQRRAGAVSLVGDAGEEQRRAVEVSGDDDERWLRCRAAAW
jgi:hypothetical protein